MEFKDAKLLEVEMKELQKKLKLFKKKRERFGLDEEEKNEEVHVLREFFLLKEEFIDLKMEEYIIKKIYDHEAYKMLDVIKKHVPWNGGLVIRNKDFNAILDKVDNFTSLQINLLTTTLIKLHAHIMKRLAEYANKPENIAYIEEVGKFVTQDNYGNILDIVTYIDTRFREFAEMILVELPDIDIEWEDEA